jgi:hypothetical protein
MKRRMVVGVLAGIGVFALSVPIAQAGGGPGSPVGFNTFFECVSISAANVGEVVSTCTPGSPCNPGDGLIHDNVKVGNGVLLCRQVDVKNSAGAFLTPDQKEEIKCYSASRPGKKEPSNERFLSDVFIAETANVSDQLGYLCAPVD